MRPLRTSLFLLGLIALGGCANGGAMFGDAPVKPKSIVVTDFTVAPEVDAIDRGFSARMDRNGSNFPILERKQRTLARVNDEIVAAIIVTLQDAGLQAQSGSEEGLTLNDQAAVISGRLRSGEAPNPKKKPLGFGPGHIDAVADMTVSYVAGGGRKTLTIFTAEAKEAGKPPAGKLAVERNKAILAVLSAEKAAPERLSPDVEAQARRLGRAIGDKVVAYAKTQGWIAPPPAPAATEGDVKLPPAKPEEKPNKPAT